MTHPSVSRLPSRASAASRINMCWLGSSMSEVLSAQTILVITIVSGVVLVASAVALPVFLVRIPPDHFQKHEKPARSGLDWCWKIGKNVFGAVFVLAGLVMLPLPGPGSLVILVGLSLLDIPGRTRLVRAIVSRPKITRFINWLRGKFGRPPLLERKVGRLVCG